MALKLFISIFKLHMPVLLGMIIGISVSMFFYPLDDSDPPCPATYEDALRMGIEMPRRKDEDEKFNFNFGYVADYNPQQVIPNKPVVLGKSVDEQKRILRPRYAATELDIKEKLFVGVLTTQQTINTLGIAVNKTSSPHVSKMMFFMNSKTASVPSGMSVFRFSDDKPVHRPFQMLRYIGSHFSLLYDYFLFLPDSTYMRAQELHHLVSKISVSHDVHLGSPMPEYPSYCDFRTGIILSKNLLLRVLDNLDWCIANALSSDISENIGKCFHKATKVDCSNIAHSLQFNSYLSPGFSFVAHRSNAESPDFKKALTIHKVETDVTMYKLHKFFCELDMSAVADSITEAQLAILETGPHHPQGNDSLTWPLGVDPPVKAKNRFDVIRWDYFTETHIYLDDDFTNMRELTGIHKLDIDDVINISKEKLIELHQGRYQYAHLINGYRRFDPTRGMEYILDLELNDVHDQGQIIFKRVNLIRPLGPAEFIPMPYVTESTKINLVLPVTAETRDGVVSFLDSYAQTCLDSGDNAGLTVVFVYNDGVDDADKDDIFSAEKSMIAYYESKYLNSAKIVWYEVKIDRANQISIFDTISSRFPADALFFLGSVGMELSTDFLNRVRMNSISGWQVYFPVGYWQYRPNIIYDEKPYPTKIEIVRNYGHFDRNVYDHAGFYNNDYTKARKNLKSRGGSLETDLFDMFLKYHDLHVFRPIEPTLLHRYQERRCAPSSNVDAYERCLTSRAEGLGPSSKLAMLIFEHQQKMNQEQLDVAQKQQNPNVEQMQPDMLK